MTHESKTNTINMKLGGKWVAECKCGWTSTPSEEASAAALDLLEHCEAANAPKQDEHGQ